MIKFNDNRIAAFSNNKSVEVLIALRAAVDDFEATEYVTIPTCNAILWRKRLCDLVAIKTPEKLKWVSHLSKYTLGELFLMAVGVDEFLNRYVKYTDCIIATENRVIEVTKKKRGEPLSFLHMISLVQRRLLQFDFDVLAEDDEDVTFTWEMLYLLCGERINHMLRFQDYHYLSRLISVIGYSFTFSVAEGNKLYNDVDYTGFLSSVLAKDRKTAMPENVIIEGPPVSAGVTIPKGKYTSIIAGQGNVTNVTLQSSFAIEVNGKQIVLILNPTRLDIGSELIYADKPVYNMKADAVDKTRFSTQIPLKESEVAQQTCIFSYRHKDAPNGTVFHSSFKGSL